MGTINGEMSPEDAHSQLIDEIANDSNLRKNITSYAWQLTKVKEDQEDYVQTTYERLIPQLKDRSVEEIKQMTLPAYMRKIMLNHHLNVLRKENRASSPDSPAGKQGSRKFELPAAQLGETIENLSNSRQEENRTQSTKSEVEEQVVFSIMVDNMIKNLPSQGRDLAVGVFFDGKTPKEFALAQNVPLSTVHYQLQQLKKKFQEFWKDEAN